MHDHADHRPSVRRSRRRLVHALAAVSTVAGIALPTAHAAASAAPKSASVGEATDEGDVVIATAGGAPATNGGSTTPFRLLLPEEASCPGDSASGNWLVQTFLIPQGDDPGTIAYGFSGPEGTQFPLYALDTRPVAHQVTQVAATPDGEGVINVLPEFSFAVFPPGYIPPGDYTIGVACEYYRTTARYWDAPIVVETNPEDQPAQLTWRLPDADAFDPGHDGSRSRWWIAALVLVGLGAGGVVVIGRRRSTSPVSRISANSKTSPVSPTFPISKTSPVSKTAHRHDDRLDPI